MSRYKKDYRGTPEERFWAKVNKNGSNMKDMITNCWDWVGASNKQKYPQIRIKGRTVKAVRFSYELHNGSIPDKHYVRHYCANSFCVRPDHLFITPDRGGWNTKSSPLITINGQLHKHCSKCETLLPYTVEYFHKVSQERGLKSYCKKCNYHINRLRRRDNWEYGLWVHAKTNAETKGLVFELDRNIIKEMFNQQDGRCYWFNVPMEPSSKPRYPLQPSLDRLDLEKGYTRDNVVLCCYVANIGRNHNTVDEFNDFITVLKDNLCQN